MYEYNKTTQKCLTLLILQKRTLKNTIHIDHKFPIIHTEY